jgi:hypothetical protein
MEGKLHAGIAPPVGPSSQRDAGGDTSARKDSDGDKKAAPLKARKTCRPWSLDDEMRLSGFCTARDWIGWERVCEELNRSEGACRTKWGNVRAQMKEDHATPEASETGGVGRCMGDAEEVPPRHHHAGQGVPPRDHHARQEFSKTGGVGHCMEVGQEVQQRDHRASQEAWQKDNRAGQEMGKDHETPAASEKGGIVHCMGNGPEVPQTVHHAGEGEWRRHHHSRHEVSERDHRACVWRAAMDAKLDLPFGGTPAACNKRRHEPESCQAEKGKRRHGPPLGRAYVIAASSSRLRFLTESAKASGPRARREKEKVERSAFKPYNRKRLPAVARVATSKSQRCREAHERLRRSLQEELAQGRGERHRKVSLQASGGRAGEGEVVVVLKATRVSGTDEAWVREQHAGCKRVRLAHVPGKVVLGAGAGAPEALPLLRVPDVWVSQDAKRSRAPAWAADERPAAGLHAPVPSSELDPLLADWSEIIDFNKCYCDGEDE